MQQRRHSRTARLMGVVLPVLLGLCLTGCDSEASEPSSQDSVSRPPVPTQGPVGEPDIATDVDSDAAIGAVAAAQEFILAARQGDCEAAWTLSDQQQIQEFGSRTSLCRHTLPTIARIALPTGTLRVDAGLMWIQQPMGISLVVTHANEGSPRILPVPYVPEHPDGARNDADKFPIAVTTADSAGREFLIRTQFLNALILANGENLDRFGRLDTVDRKSGRVDLTSVEPEQADVLNNRIENLMPPAINQTVDAMTSPDPIARRELPPMLLYGAPA